MTNSRQREVRSVTHEAMEKLHKALETMPAEGKFRIDCWENALNRR